ncbi:hypothetical protein ILUMI_03383 [Ignelater luminosus]|uniref:PiggyBac transposable element-derived protein domain-containing protein n=1 Tax=Ignelater luminosus TaxID=2038154 RepID=A0A8K0DLX1_IGNLU|nr:hypothetical protein ILUMI_03383 [Ignelater luminosus]
MICEDLSDNSSDPEYEISDNSEMSDSDGSYSDTDDDKDIPNVSFFNWNVLSDFFADKLPKPFQDLSADYDSLPAIDFQECKDPFNSFECFMSSNIAAKLCEWTNKRVEMYFLQKNTITLSGLQWKKLEIEEMCAFIALDFLTGPVKCPRISDYWSDNILCAGSKVFDKSVMSRNRYLSILKFIRFLH